MIHGLIAAFLVVYPAPDVWSGEIRADLRLEGPLLALDVALITLGVLSAAVYRLINKSGDKGFVWLGALSGAYGLGLLLSSKTFQFMYTVDKTQRPGWNYPAWALAYMLIPLAALLLGEVFPEWDRTLLRRLVLLLGVFVVIAIATDAIVRRPGSLSLPYYAIVVIGLVAVARAIPPRADGSYSRWLRITPLGLGALVLIKYLWHFYSASFPLRFQKLEALGFICWLAALGAAMVRVSVERAEAIDAPLAAFPPSADVRR
jgi:hypothetical protein